MNCADIVYINAPHRSAPLLQQEPRIPQGLLNTVFMWSMLCSSVGGSETNADMVYGLDVGVVYSLDVGLVYGLDVGVVYSLDVGVVYGLDLGVVYSLDAVLAGDCRQSSFLIHHLIASVHAITDYNYTMHHLLFCRYILIILFIFDFQFYILSRFISDLQFHI